VTSDLLPQSASPTYPAARLAAARICANLARHIIALPSGDPAHGLAPDAAAVESLIEAAFWASLRREEGFVPRISLAFVPCDGVHAPLIFERPLPLAAQPLTRLAPSVERPGIHLGVWRNAGEFTVWGATRNLPPFCLVIEVIAPGLLVVKQSREESEKYINVAVLQGDEIKIVDEQSASLQDCPKLVTSLLGFAVQATPADSFSALIQLAVSMRAHGRGGSLLVVPANSAPWRESVVHPILYGLDPPFSALAELMRQPAPADDAPRRHWSDSFRRAIDGVAGLTAVDGATVITDRYDVLAFGVKIVRRKGSPQVADVIVTEPIEGSRPEVVEPGQLGGTRHLSAAQFVLDQHDAIALVASQDGRFTVFAWSPCEEKVHAHRIESLLL
jgi:hypothetical protein